MSILQTIANIIKPLIEMEYKSANQYTKNLYYSILAIECLSYDKQVKGLTELIDYHPLSNKILYNILMDNFNDHLIRDAIIASDKGIDDINVIDNVHMMTWEQITIFADRIKNTGDKFNMACLLQDERIVIEDEIIKIISEDKRYNDIVNFVQNNINFQSKDLMTLLFLMPTNQN